jgi:hypothetical protein
MLIDFCSDLHVDAWHNQTQLHDPMRSQWTGEPYRSTFLYLDWESLKNPGSEVLVIAGDIANDLDLTREVVLGASAYYDHVVFQDGNHDHYGSGVSVDHGMQILAAFADGHPNIHYLDPGREFQINGTLFLGATGWYDFRAYEARGIYSSAARRAWSQYSNDSRYLDFGGKTVESIAAEQAINLTDRVSSATVDDSIETIVMTTHMSPRDDLMEWKDGDVVWNVLTPSYVNTALAQVLEADVNGKIGHWIYGHTHQRKITKIGDVTYANNARGYPRENAPFSLTQLDLSNK